jgi:hypothetical protein
MGLLRFDLASLLRPRRELVEFVHRLAAGAPAYAGAERRAEPRWTIVTPVPVQPLDERLRPHGEPFVAISRDVSPGGMALYHLQPVPVKSLLAVELRAPEGDTLQAVLEVVRCRTDGLAFEIGGQFLAKVYDTPESDAGR